jgi:hypothetical protein
MPLRSRTDIEVFPEDHPLHHHIVYDPSQREYYNCITDIFLTQDDISFYKLRPDSKITSPIPYPLPEDYFTNWEE